LENAELGQRMRINIYYESQPTRATSAAESARLEPEIASPQYGESAVYRVQDEFGIGLAPRRVTVVEDLEIEPRCGEIILVTGPSGSGKSSILRRIASAVPNSIDANSVAFDPEKPIIDNFQTNYADTLYFLSVAGLAEAFLFLRRYEELSDGQKYRFKLAKVLSQCKRQKAKGRNESLSPSAFSKYIIADEFCSTLDRLTAKVIAYNVRKMATKFAVGFALATAHDDIVTDLQPDILVRKSAGSGVSVERSKFAEQQTRNISFAENIQIREGTTEDWKYFSQFHYKSHHLGAVDKIFVMTLEEEPIGIVVYAYPATQNRLRNLITGGRYCGGVTASARRRLLNSELRVVQRIVIDPRFRGLGFASELLRETAPLVGVRFIECLAVMGAHSRFLENAGFVRVGMCTLPRSGRILLGAFKNLGLGAETLHSPEHLLEKLTPVVNEKRPASGGLLQALTHWWRERSHVKGSKHRDRKITEELVLENLPYITRALAKDITSRPYYFFLDTKNPSVSRQEGGK